MGKGWDSFADYQPQTDRGLVVHLALALLQPWERGFVVFLVDVWTECMRVLKPGGHVCAWALPKTGDLAGLALRLAGFDMRDSLAHLFGQGMPHGIDISKAIDKAAGAEREVVGQHRGVPGLKATAGWNDGPFSRGEVGNITAPATDLAKAWHDWNTQLAPGYEQWLLARKPSPLTFAATAVEHGTGALDIGACRVPVTSTDLAEMEGRSGASTRGHTYGEGLGNKGIWSPNQTGRWPSNVLLSHSPDCADRCVDGCPVLELDRQSGVQKDGVAVKSNTPVGKVTARHTFALKNTGEDRTFGGSGGASRFFPTFRYQAKAKRRDIPGRPDLTIDHPTHKHPDLMRWLVRLLAAKTEQVEGGAIVLDPFAGSGTTGVACVAEGVRFLGIELSEASVEQARARIAAATGDAEAAREATAKAPIGSQTSLF